MPLTRPADNPLLQHGVPPAFGEVRAEHVLPALEVRIEEALRASDLALSEGVEPSWEAIIAPIDAAEERVERAWGPVDHLNRVLRDEGLRAAHREGSARYTAWRTRMGQDPRLLRAAHALERLPLSPVQKKVLGDLLRELTLAGVELPEAEQARCAQIRLRLNRLATLYSEHVVDASDLARITLGAEDVAALPAPLRASLRAQALRDDPDAPEGRHALPMHSSLVTPFLATQPDRELRRQAYVGFVTLATAGEQDNGPLILETLALRAQLAELFGKRSFAELTLQAEMLRSPEAVRAFLLTLADRIRPRAAQELARLLERARQDGLQDLQRWDIGYYRERLRQELIGVSEQELRSWFPLPRVLAGIAEMLGRLFGLELRVRSAAGEPFSWDPALLLLEIMEGETLQARILVDPLARPGKRGGAWVGGLVPGLPRDEGRQVPLIVLCASFPPAEGDSPPLITHENVRTLLHELGHALHHALSDAPERRVAGTRGVPRDGVELPSKLLEQWVWQPDALHLLSGHVETGEPLPAEQLQRLRQARDLTRGVDLIRQLELALFDLELHDRPPPVDEAGVRAVLNEARACVALLPAPPEDRFANQFQHIFSGGYATRYYGYLWSEQLAADAFSFFEEQGIWSREAGERLRREVLAHGGSRDLSDLFVAFRGRPPTPDALARQLDRF